MKFLKDWMLPIAMTLGAIIFLALHYCPSLDETSYMSVARTVQPVLIGIMLFLQLNVVGPRDLKLHKWHFELLAVQTLAAFAFAFAASRFQDGTGRILLEAAMLCFICPTAAAAGVITSKIGGSLPDILSYTVLIDFVAALLIPLMVPLVHPSADAGFLPLFLAIIRKVFAILVLPTLLAWFIRYAFPGLQKWLAKYVGWAFYVWSVGLTLAISLATGALVNSGIGVFAALLIALVSLLCCIFQFWLGRRVARSYGRVEELTAGQSLGQKNTAVCIWIGATFMDPLSSVAGGFYSVWHNVWNSYQLEKVKK